MSDITSLVLPIDVDWHEETEDSYRVADDETIRGDSAKKADLQALLDRTRMARRFPANTSWKITEEGGLAVLLKNTGGGTVPPGSLVSPDRTLTISNDSNEQLSSLVLTGYAVANSDLGKWYLKITKPGGAATVSVYSDSGRTALVCAGALADDLGGTITLAEEGASGLSGTVDIEAACTADATIEVDIGAALGTAPTPASGTDAIGVAYASAATGADQWVVVAGVADVLMKANVGCPAGGWLYMSDVAGRATAEISKVAASVEKEIGYSVSARTAGATTTLIRTKLALR